MGRPWRYRIESKPGYLHVHQQGSFATERDVHDFHRALEDAMREEGTTRLLFDNRDTDAAPEELRAMMYAWMSEHHELSRVAVLIESDRVSRRATKTAELNRVRLRTFGDVGAAAAWLLA